MKNLTELAQRLGTKKTEVLEVPLPKEEDPLVPSEVGPVSKPAPEPILCANCKAGPHQTQKPQSLPDPNDFPLIQDAASVQVRVAAIKLCIQAGDVARATEIETDLHYDTLRAIAERRCTHPVEVAGSALSTLTLSFHRSS